MKVCKNLLLLIVLWGVGLAWSSSSSGFMSSSSFAVVEAPMAYLRLASGELGLINLTTGEYRAQGIPAELPTSNIIYSSNYRQWAYASSMEIIRSQWIGLPALESMAKTSTMGTQFANPVNAMTTDGSTLYFSYDQDGTPQISQQGWNSQEPTYMDISGFPDPFAVANLAVNYNGLYAYGSDGMTDRLFRIQYGATNEVTSVAGRTLKGLASHPGTGQVVAYDPNAGKFLLIDPSLDAFTELNITTSSATDIRVTYDTTLYWTNALGLWKAKPSQAPVRVGPELDIRSFDLDLNNHAEYFPLNPFTVKANTFQVVEKDLQIANAYYDGDELLCTYEDLGTMRSKIIWLGKCRAAILQNQGNAMAGEKDSVLVILTDRRGYLDTATMILDYRDDVPPMLQGIPTTWDVKAGDENILAIGIQNDLQDTANLRIDVVTSVNSFQPGDETCSSFSGSWFAQIFTPSTSGSLGAVKLMGAYPVPMLVSIYDGQYIPNGEMTPLYSQVFNGDTSIGVVKYAFRNSMWLISGYQYTVVVRKLDTTDITPANVCESTHDTSGSGLIKDGASEDSGMEMPYELVILNGTPSGLEMFRHTQDSVYYRYVPSSNTVGQTSTWLITATDEGGITQQGMDVYVSGLYTPSYNTGDSIRIPMRITGDMNSYRYINDWNNKESTLWPRSYEVDTVGFGTDQFFEYSPSVNGSSLQLYLREGAGGWASFQVRRCDDAGNCSNYDTAHILLSQAPTLSLDLVDTLFAGEIKTSVATVSDIDVGDSAHLKFFLRSQTVGMEQTDYGNLVQMRTAAQTFVVTEGGNLGGFQVYGDFRTRTKIAVGVYKLVNLPTSLYIGAGQSEEIFNQEIAVDQAGLGWHTFHLKGPYLIPGQVYAVTYGTQWCYDSVPVLDFGMSSMNMLSGSLFKGDSGYSQQPAFSGDLAMRVLYDSMPPAWASAVPSGNIWNVELKPTLSDTGVYTINAFADDSTASVMVTQTVVVRSPPPIWNAGVDVKIVKAKGQKIKIERDGWVDTTGMPVGRIFHANAITAADSVLFASDIHIDSDGNLSFGQNIDLAGIYRFQSRACLSDGMTCSAYDTTSVIVTHAPVLAAMTLDSILAGSSLPLTLSATDADGDALTYNVGLLKRFSKDTLYQKIESKAAVGLTFVASDAMQPSALRIYGKFSHEYVRLILASVSGGLHDPGKALADVQVQVPTNMEGWHTLHIPNAPNLVAGLTYHISLFYEEPTSLITYHVDTLGNNANGSLVEFTASVNATTGELDLNPTIQEAWDLKAEILEKVLPPSWMTLAGKDLTLMPSTADTGKYFVVIETNDGKFSATNAQGLVVYQNPAVALVWIAGPKVKFPAALGENLHRTIPAWVDGSRLPANIFFETGFLTSADSSALVGYACVKEDGSLEISQKAGVAGAYAFWSRMCTISNTICSERDTTYVELGNSPQIAWVNAPDTLWQGDDTKVSLFVNDADGTDSLAFQLTRLETLYSDKLSHKLAKASAVGQTFKLMTVTKLGAFRIRAKFPKPFVHLIVAPVVAGIPNAPEERLVDVQMAVTANVLDWHELPIPNSPMLSIANEYHVSIGYDDTLSLIEYGVDTLAKANYGSLVEYKETGDTTSNRVEPFVNNALDLQAEIVEKKAAPIWAKLSGIEVVFSPLVVDSGRVSLLVEVKDGLYGAGSIANFMVAKRIEIDTNEIDTKETDTNFVDTNASRSFAVRSRLNGQALEVNTSALADSISDKVTLEVHLMSALKDSVLPVGKSPWVLAPLLPGNYQIAWKLKWNKTGDILRSGVDTLVVNAPLLTPPALDDWYMVGFGSEALPTTEIKSSSLLFAWENATGFADYGDYTPRSAMTHLLPGKGYWYQAIGESDTLMPKPFSQMPGPLDLDMRMGNTGWNMIANPWSWRIALPAEQTFWSWRAETGSYEQVTQLDAFMAAWVHVGVDTTLSLNPAPSFQYFTALPKVMLARSQGKDWIVQVSLSSGNQRDEWNSFGRVNGASIVMDEMDDPEPPKGFENSLSLSFMRNGVRLARDVLSSEGDQWNVVLDAAFDRRATLEFAGIESIHAQGLQLVLRTPEGKVISVHESAVTLDLRKGSQVYQLLVVPKDADYTLAGGLLDFQVRGQGKYLDLSWNVALDAAGQTGTMQWNDLQGRVLWSTTLKAQVAGKNELRIPRIQSGVGSLVLRIGKEQRAIRVMGVQ